MTDTVRSIRPEIASSWHRAQLAGLHPESGGRPTLVDVDVSSRLMSAAAPVLRELAEHLDGNAFSLMLTDRDCRIVHRWGGDHRFVDAIDAYGVAVGVQVDEESFGTNAMGTAMETGSSVVVHGAEHFLYPFKILSCYGHPVRHPLTRRVEGILDITAIGPASNPLFGPLVRRAVRDIEVRLVDGARDGQRRLFLAFQYATRLRGAPVAVLGGDVVLANRACLDVLGTADPAVLRALLPGGPGPLVRELDLGPRGRVPVTVERVEGTVDGVLVRLGALPVPAPDRPVPDRAVPVRRAPVGAVPVRPAPEPARPTGHAVLVAGEPGTGRSRVAAELAGTGPVVTLDAAAAVAGSERDWASRLVGFAARPATTVVVDDVHVLPERLCAVLRRVLVAGRARLVLTSCPVDELPPHVARLAGRCVRRVEPAPLRERSAELAALLAAMGALARPDRDWTCTPRALDALAAQPWPGNLAELAVLVDELAARPATGRIDLDDLPARYRSAGRAARLGGRERAERAAILGALHAAGGNKVAAARQLGISRTTLYRRMRALAVPDGAAVRAGG
ncbi:MAG: sigma-54-dependent Fis family transcriptional regulator [Pseudonocardia sp.]